MLDHDSLEQLRRYSAIPNAFGIYDHDRSARANSQARRLAALDPLRAKEQSFALEKLRQQAIDDPPAAVGRTEASGAHQHMSPVGLHDWLELLDLSGRRHDTGN
jgi:hypothetical protein